MADLISPRSLPVPTPSALDDSASQLSSIFAAESPSALPSLIPDREYILVGGQKLQNFSTVEADKVIYSLNTTTTGCYAPGAVPLARALNDTCSLGWFCPNSSAREPPQYCPPSDTCQATRLSKGTCPPQGVLEPVVCDAGYYCPPGGKQKIPCDKGTFCPMGSYQPIHCSRGAVCPPQSQRQIVTIPFGFMVTFDVLLGIIVAAGFFISRRRKQRKRSYASLQNLKELSNLDTDDIELIQKPGNLSQHPDVDEDLTSNPDFLVFMRYIAKIVKTKEVGLSFEFQDLQFEAKGGNKILHGVSGSILSASMWAIMGGSGAGKSTFVNVLMGKTKHTGGSIKVNGHHKDMSKYKKLIGYVPQDDILLPELTVRENILHSARIRLPMTWRDNGIQEYVDALISCIGLSHVQHSRVGDANKPVISGGQRKRVSIGMELAAAPMAIFLDEPTSGLDATSASSIMRLLKAISKLGVTTITIIHQPREQIFNGFDNLLLLGNGSQIYAGPTSDAATYFGSLGYIFPTRANPADTIMDIITGNGQEYTQDPAWSENAVNKLLEEWRTHVEEQTFEDSHHLNPTDTRQSTRSPSIISSPEQEQSLRQTMQKRGASWPAQTYYCCKRSITQQVRNKGSFFFEIGVGALAGGIIGLSAFAAKGQLFRGLYVPPFTILSSAVDYQSVPQVGLLGGMAIGLAASAPAVKVFGEEKLIFNREAASGHSMSAYYVGKMVSVFPRICLSSLHFSVFMGILATPLMSFSQMFAANMLYFFCVYGLASCVGMLVKREDGPLLAVMASLIIGVLGGVAPPLSKVKAWHLEGLWRLSPGVWFTEAYVSQNLLPLDYLYMLDMASRGMGFTLGHYPLDMWILFIIGSIYRIIAFVLLVTVHRKR
ncbi:ABC transporter-like protein [Zopfia rhizophila CBS 207.26]|uniref:ABC transporter-like protein n=1 Tax=Zopfia rhizophila CBS 207.26 TaxID=1314779 RepID=A0A6A6EV01_9PEZI|nr:ABC transporter-like protein [Zopfia rhizophila CBS 207.26]